MTKDTKVEDTKITTICNQYFIRNYLQKILKMPSSEAWVYQSNDL
jgi:hypothetical protein